MQIHILSKKLFSTFYILEKQCEQKILLSTIGFYFSNLNWELGFRIPRIKSLNDDALICINLHFPNIVLIDRNIMGKGGLSRHDTAF